MLDGGPARAQQTVEEDKPPAGAIIQKTFIAKCMACHGIGNSEGRAPTRETLMKLTPEAVYAALATGSKVAPGLTVAGGMLFVGTG